MPWDELVIEKQLKKSLIKNYAKTFGQQYYADYLQAKRVLEEEVWNQIKGAEPNLTDHGPDHVRDVLNNVQKLLGDSIKTLKANDLYCICVAALFHDVGNLHGRDQHQQKITDIYDHIRNSDPRFNQEKNNILRICAAHCGYSEVGDRDTIRFVPENSQLFSDTIRSQEIAAIIRFADELAEGYHRTSNYMIKKHKYKHRSTIHHDYASITSVNIDRNLERIAITYTLHFNEDLRMASRTTVKNLLNYTYSRIIKLNQERKYARYYTDKLAPFKKIHVEFNFYLNKNLLSLGLDPIILSDIVLPGDDEKTIPERDGKYHINQLINKIKDMTNEGEKNDKRISKSI